MSMIENLVHVLGRGTGPLYNIICILLRAIHLYLPYIEYTEATPRRFGFIAVAGDFVCSVR